MTNTQRDTVYAKNPDVVYRKIAGEFVLVPVRQKAVDLKSVFTMNESAAFIWEHIDGSASVPQITEKFMEEYDAVSSDASRDIDLILSQFEGLSFIKKA